MDPDVEAPGEDVLMSETEVKEPKCKKPICILLRSNVLLLATLLSVVLGVIIGVVCRPLNLPFDTIQFIGFPGEVLMSLFKMLLLPLLVSSMVSGLSNLKGTSRGKLGLFTMVYYICTTLIAVTVGVVLAVTIRPGDVTVASSSVLTRDSQPLPTALDTFFDLIRNLFPPNIAQAAVQHSRTVFTQTNSADVNNIAGISNPCYDITSNNTNVTDYHESNLNCSEMITSNTAQWSKSVVFKDGLNVTGVLLFFAVFGILLNRMGEKGQLMVEFFNIFSEVILQMTKMVMWYCPIGIMFIIINKILSVPDLARAAQQLGMYMVTGLTGLAFHSLIVLPAIYFILTRQNPFRVSLHILQATMVALGTSSSSAALPLTLHCCQNKLKFNKNICNFVLPIGATINMDGLAIVQAMTPIFIAQMNNKQMMFGDILTISIGAAGVPGTGLITLLAVIAAAGLPVEDVYMVLPIEWFMGRMVTMVNVYGDALAAGVFSHFFSER